MVIGMMRVKCLLRRAREEVFGKKYVMDDAKVSGEKDFSRHIDFKHMRYIIDLEKFKGIIF